MNGRGRGRGGVAVGRRGGGEERDAIGIYREKVRGCVEREDGVGMTDLFAIRWPSVGQLGLSWEALKSVWMAFSLQIDLI